MLLSNLEWLILLGTFLFAYNYYHDGKFLRQLMAYKKYYQVGGVIIAGLAAIVAMRHDPVRGYNFLNSLNGVMQFTPFIPKLPPQQQNSWVSDEPTQPQRKFKRSVSETKKKFVASSQNWKCAMCGQTLNHTFEVDHQQRLDQSGDNSVENLQAMCVTCHRLKTAEENM
jgi:hypothetical protein